MDRLNIALVEFAPEWENAGESLRRLDPVMDGLFADGFPLRPDIVVLPEFFAVGFTMNPLVAEPEEGADTLSWMLASAARCGCAVTGSVPVSDAGGRRFNRLYFAYPDGSIGSYDKRHLFFGGENENYTAGQTREIFEYRGWRILAGICFDMRFPEWCRNDRDFPADLYLNVANWPSGRRAAADILIKARSIENVCWSVFCNRTGTDATLEYSGNSVVIDHRGRDRSHRISVSGVPVVCSTLDKGPMMRFREGFPILDLID